MENNQNYLAQVQALIDQRMKENPEEMKRVLAEIEASKQMKKEEPKIIEAVQAPKEYGSIAVGRRKVTIEVVSAFLQKRREKKGNTETDGRVLYLHGNSIARWTDGGNLEIRSAGWETNTTKERLNGIPNVNITQKNYEWFLNGKPWERSHEWTPI
jgi:hypothetical protein